MSGHSRATLRDLYTTLLCQAVSQDSQRLVVGDNFGRLAVFNTSSIQQRLSVPTENCTATPSSGDQRQQLRPDKVLTCGSAGAIRELLVDKQRHLLAIVGTTIRAFTWNDIAAATDSGSGGCLSAAWSIDVPATSANTAHGASGVEAADLCGDCVYAARGDSVFVYDLETRQLCQTLNTRRVQGCVRAVRGVRQTIPSSLSSPASSADTAVSAELVSCGDEGSVLLWDRRRGSHDPVSRLVPTGPDSGAPLSSVDAVGEWVVCGGAGMPVLFHRRSGSVVASLSRDCPPGGHRSVNTNVVRFLEDGGIVGVGGDRADMAVFSAMSGDEKPTSCVKTTCSSVFSLLVAPSERQNLVLAAGCGSSVDVCNTQFRDFSISCV